MIEPNDPRLRLCIVTDDLREGTGDLVERVLAAERGGATLVLLRLKHADAHLLVEAGRALVSALRIPVVVSERLDVALSCGAAGVHLGAGSMPVVAVRSQAPAGFLIGVSVSDASELEQTTLADFVTMGPVYAPRGVGLGLSGFTALVAACGRPVLAIGGIDAASVPFVRAAGASGVAVIRSVLAAPDPESAVAALCAAWLMNQDGTTPDHE